MNEIVLEKPNLSHKKQVMNYRKYFFDMNESFDGCARLEDTECYENWLNF